MLSTIEIQKRVNVKNLEPEAWKALMEIDHHLSRGNIDQKLRELIKIRASQLNKCAFCLEIHTKDAITIGESERRIFAISAWQESPLFTDKERAVLQLTDEVTKISTAGVLEETYREITQYFSDKEIAELLLGISHINFLNRIGVATKLVHPN